MTTPGTILGNSIWGFMSISTAKTGGNGFGRSLDVWRSHVPSLEATVALGHRLGQVLRPGTVLLLSGDLGAGKTTLVQAIAQGLGITDPVSSPTFVLLNEYLDGRSPLYHFDLYRLEPAGVVALDPELYWEGVEVDPGIVAIEWAERLPELPGDRLEIHLVHREPPQLSGLELDTPAPARTITIQKFGTVLGWDEIVVQALNAGL